MIPFQERKRIRKILYSKVSLLLLFLVLLFVSKGVWGIYQKSQVALSERDISKRELLDVETRTDLIKKSLTRLDTPRGTEEEVRQKYTVARKGEEVVVVVDDSAKKSKNDDVVDTRSIWQKLASLFAN